METKAQNWAGERIRVRGLVQGVGLRPMIWRLATEWNLSGCTYNDAEGVVIRVAGDRENVNGFVNSLVKDPPRLARIDAIERRRAGVPEEKGFQILVSGGGLPNTGVLPDASSCSLCLEEIADPTNRRHRHPFANCTNCGPRLSIVRAIPYDRQNTAMASFPMCVVCQVEYGDPANRRFHAQPNACPDCGPEIWLADGSGHCDRQGSPQGEAAMRAACRLLEQGEILAIKGVGGFHLVCDALNTLAVQHLRTSKRRFDKPFALMAPNFAAIETHCHLSQLERVLLKSPAAPIVLLQRRKSCAVPEEVSPRHGTLGFMLPYSPLHHLLLQELKRPLIMTSGNVSDEPQCIDNADARQRLRSIAGHFLLHDRDILNRVDDSVARVVGGKVRMIRRARGYAPSEIRLPPGFENCLPTIAMGGELKNSFCLLLNDRAIVSQHIGDLENASALADYRKQLAFYHRLFRFEPKVVSVDMHPEYLSSKDGRALARMRRLQLDEVQHHHAHIASCLGENGISITTPPVLGIALDGLGYGADGGLWGGEFLLAGYCRCRRVASLNPVAMLGGSKAIQEPWRNTYANIVAAIGRDSLNTRWGGLELTSYLAKKPLDTLDAMLRRGVNSPLASSCGRLFDAVAAAIGICRERVSYEGQAAAELEALVDATTLDGPDLWSYPFAIAADCADGLPRLDPSPLWPALFADLQRGVAQSILSARFHLGLAKALCNMAEHLAATVLQGTEIAAVALSGGVMQNAVLLELLTDMLRKKGFRVLTHEQLPSNDGGLSFGQALVTAARFNSDEG